MSKNFKRVVSMIIVFAMLLTSAIFTQSTTVEAAKKKVTKITLNQKKAKLQVGDKLQLKVKKVVPAKASKAVTWKSSNKKVATVTAKGIVKAKKAGSVTITAKSKKNPKVKAKCTIQINKKKAEKNETEVWFSAYEKYFNQLNTTAKEQDSTRVWKCLLVNIDGDKIPECIISMPSDAYEPDRILLYRNGKVIDNNVADASCSNLLYKENTGLICTENYIGGMIYSFSSFIYKISPENNAPKFVTSYNSGYDEKDCNKIVYRLYDKRTNTEEQISKKEFDKYYQKYDFDSFVSPKKYYSTVKEAYAAYRK